MTNESHTESGIDELFIRPATQADATIISSVLLESFVEFKHLYTEAAFSATTISAEQVMERMRKGIVWAATKGNRILGTVTVIKKPQGLYICGMAVLPGARGLKTGPRLLEQVEQYAKENKITRLFLFTTPYLTTAIHLYKSFGFAPSSEVDDSFFGTPGFEMEKFIPLVDPDK